MTTFKDELLVLLVWVLFGRTAPLNGPPLPLFAVEFVLLFCDDSSKEPLNIWAPEWGEIGSMQLESRLFWSPRRKWEFHFYFAVIISNDLIGIYGLLGWHEL